jgi:hypothetical protein
MIKTPKELSMNYYNRKQCKNQMEFHIYYKIINGLKFIDKFGKLYIIVYNVIFLH